MEKFKNHILALLACVSLLFALTSCDAEMKALTTPVSVSFTIDESLLTDTKACITAIPAEDEVYYYWDVIECALLDSMKGTDMHFMEIVIDSAYIDYLAWRHDKLIEGVPFISPFCQHSMSYGHTEYDYTDLTPNTDYYVYGFCVNKDSNQPIGPLYKQRFKTKPAKDKDYRSPMTFEFEVHGEEVMAIPSIEGKNDSYFFTVINADVLDDYDGNIEKYILEVVDLISDLDLLPYFLYRSIATFTYSPRPGITYIAIAAPYDTNIEKSYYTRKFTYDGSPDFTIPRGHDPR